MSHPSYPLNLTPVEVRLLREHLPSEELGCLESVHQHSQVSVSWSSLLLWGLARFFLGKVPLLPLLSILGVGRESMILKTASCFVKGLSHIWL